MSMLVLVASKSSIYAVPTSPTSFVCPGIRWANSAFTWKDDGALASIHGTLSISRLSHCKSVFQLAFTPQIVFANGSLPVFTLVVNGFSRICMMVPPTVKSLLNSYSKCAPNSDLRCIENKDWLSNFTSTFVPASMIDWFKMVTVPMV